MPRLDVVLIRSPRLAARAASAAEVVRVVRDAARQAGWESTECEFRELDGGGESALRPEDHKDAIEPSPKTDGQPTAFQQNLGALSLQQLSNLLRHRAVARRAAASDTDLTLVLEDDVLCNNGTAPSLVRFLQAVAHNAFSADIVFGGLPSVSQDGKLNPDSLVLKDANLDDVELLRTRSSFLIVPSKESYFMFPSGARAIADHWAKVSFRTSVQLSWSIHVRDLRAYHFRNNVFIDGSKLGVYSGSCSPNGGPSYNRAFVNALQHLQNKELDQAQRELDALVDLRNPEVLHQMGIVAYLRGDPRRAHALLLEAFDLAESSGACLNHTSGLLNNAINLCKFVT